MIARFADPERGGFFSTSDDHEQLVARRKDLEDTPIPSGSSSARSGCCASPRSRARTLRAPRPVGARARCVFAPRHPQAFGHLLQALAFALHPPREVALAGEGREALERVMRERLWPAVVLAAARVDTGGVPLLEGRTAVDGRRRPTCASGSRAGGRSRTRPSSRRCCPG